MSEPRQRILVVDDNPATRYSTRRVLEAAGFDVIEAVNGRHGLSRSHEGVDLVVLDINMPDMDGIAVCRDLRLDPVTRQVPIVHLTATALATEDLVRGLEAGADAYLIHPVDPAVLVATVSAFLRARAAEDALRRSETRFRAIFEQAATGMVLLDDGLRIAQANAAFCRLLDRPREQIEGQLLAAFCDGDEKDGGIAGRIADLLHGAGSCVLTFPLRRADDVLVPTHWSVALQGSENLAVAVVTDLTEQRMLEASRERLLAAERNARFEADRANRAKDEFLAVLSHELRNPLSAILGWTEVLKRGRRTPDETTAGIAAIERNARLQTQLVYDLLDVSRIISGRISVEPAPMRLETVVRAVMDSLAPVASDKDVRLSLDVLDELPPLIGDAGRLQQVVNNIIGNALKFTPGGGRVRVTLGRDGNHAELVVSDTGVGIRPEFLPHIFERFRQADQTSTRAHGGLGLGLAIAWHLVGLHGGTIEASSAGADLGSEFRIRLPLHAFADADLAIPGAGDPAANAADGATPVNLTGRRILLVEDSDDARALTRKILVDAGADVVETSSAEKALALLHDESIAGIVSDIGMPGMDGIDLIRLVRARRDGRHLPALALTAFARKEDERLALAAGFQRYLPKPTSPADLLRAVQAMLDPARRDH